MVDGVRKLWQDEKGANLFEYVLLVAFALTVVAGIRALYTAISAKFTQAAGELNALNP